MRKSVPMYKIVKLQPREHKNKSLNSDPLQNYKPAAQDTCHANQAKSESLNQQFDRLAERCSSISYHELLREMERILKNVPPDTQRISNMCQYWLFKINCGLAHSEHRLALLERASRSPAIKRCMSSVSASMACFKQYVAAPEVNNYVVEGLLKGSVLVAAILRDERLSPRNRYQVLLRYPLLVRMVYDPDSLVDWKLSQNGEDRTEARRSNKIEEPLRRGNATTHKEDSEDQNESSLSDESWEE